MPRKVVISFLLSILVVFGGCTQVQVPSSPDSTTSPKTSTVTVTSTATSTTTPKTTSTYKTTFTYTDCPYYLDVEPAREEQISRVEQTLAYQNLSVERQHEFKKALKNGSIELGATLPSTWGGPRILEYQGEQYYTVAFVC